VPPRGDIITASSDVVFDPAEVFADGPTPAVSDLLIRLTAGGWIVEERLPAGAFRAALPALGSRRLGEDWVWPYATRGERKLSICRTATPPVVGRSPHSLRRRVEDPVPVPREPSKPLHFRARATLKLLTNKDNWTRHGVSRSARRRVLALARRLRLWFSDRDDV
jgi:hypothetical protein